MVSLAGRSGGRSRQGVWAGNGCPDWFSPAWGHAPPEPGLTCFAHGGTGGAIDVFPDKAQIEDVAMLPGDLLQLPQGIAAELEEQTPGVVAFGFRRASLT